MTAQNDPTAMATAGPRDFAGARRTGDACTPSFLLAAACCRWPPSESRAAAVRAAAANVTDWNDFLRIVRRHRVAGLVHDALSSSGIALPPAVAVNLARRAQRIVWRDLALAAESARLQRVLETAGIAALILKGAALAQLAYGSVTAKQTRDIDVLIPPACIEPALRVLEAEGYTLSYPAEHLSTAQRSAVFRYAREVQLVHRGRKIRLELQWRAVNNPLLLQGVDAHSPAQCVTLPNGANLRTLALDDLFAYLCVHGAQHAWSRLKWLADLNALIAANNADVARLYGHAQKLGAGICAGLAFLLCSRLFALGLPAAVATEIAANRRLQRLAAMAMKTLAEQHAEAEPNRSFAGIARVELVQFLLGDGPAFLAAQCRVEAVRIRDIVDLPLPPALQFLYPALRLPLWLWRHATAAVGRRGET